MGGALEVLREGRVREVKHMGKEGPPVLPENSQLNTIHAFHGTTWFGVSKK